MIQSVRKNCVNIFLYLLPAVKSWMSSYHAFSNKPLINIDPNGNNDEVYINGSKNATTQPEIWDDTIAKFKRIRLSLIESPLF